MYDNAPYQFVTGHITISTLSTSVRSIYLILISKLNHVSNLKSVLNSKLFHYFNLKAFIFFLKINAPWIPRNLQLYELDCFIFVSVQSLSRVRLFGTPRTAARQASLSIANSRSSLRLMSIESVMPSNHLILCRPLLLPPSVFPSIRVFSNKSILHSGDQSIGALASASIFVFYITSLLKILSGI